MANCRVCTTNAENSMHVCSACRDRADQCSMCYGNGKIQDYENFWECWSCFDIRAAIEETDLL